jgi:hypothetical protein
MAKYGSAAKKEVKKAVHKTKEGTQKQAIAIGLSKARKKGAKVPAKKKG